MVDLLIDEGERDCYTEKHSLLRELAVARENWWRYNRRKLCDLFHLIKFPNIYYKWCMGEREISPVKVLIRKIIVKFNINACFTTPLSIFSNLTMLERL